MKLPCCFDMITFIFIDIAMFWHNNIFLNRDFEITTSSLAFFSDSFLSDPKEHNHLKEILSQKSHKFSFTKLQLKRLSVIYLPCLPFCSGINVRNNSAACIPNNIITLRPRQNGRHFADDIFTWWRHQMETFPRNWPFVREIHRSPVNFPHKGQWRGALMFSLIYAWINDWVNNLEAGDLRRQHGHYDVIVMKCILLNEIVRIPIKISMKFIPKGPINNIPALVHIMAWRRPGDKPLSEPMMVSLTTHICVTQSQWVIWVFYT